MPSCNPDPRFARKYLLYNSLIIQLIAPYWWMVLSRLLFNQRSMEGKKLSCTQQIVAMIRYLRRKKEYSQEYMASHLDISQNAYCKMEMGKIPMTVDRFCEIARILEVSPVELLAQVKLK